jgi:hypothetical protein
MKRLNLNMSGLRLSYKLRVKLTLTLRLRLRHKLRVRLTFTLTLRLRHKLRIRLILTLTLRLRLSLRLGLVENFFCKKFTTVSFLAERNHIPSPS